MKKYLILALVAAAGLIGGPAAAVAAPVTHLHPKAGPDWKTIGVKKAPNGFDLAGKHHIAFQFLAPHAFDNEVAIINCNGGGLITGVIIDKSDTGATTFRSIPGSVTCVKFQLRVSPDAPAGSQEPARTPFDVFANPA